MIEPDPLTRQRWCPRCLTRMRVSLNPYYGVGLAVHRHLSSCPQCGFVEFLPATPRDSAPQTVVEPAQSPSFVHRVRARAARWFAAPH